VPLCVLDAVFSLNARYQATRRVPERYCERFGLPLWRPRAELPPTGQQHTVTEFLTNLHRSGVEAFAADVIRNRQRTSTRNGILKAEAARRFAAALAERGVQYLQDVTAAATDQRLEAAVRAIPGQRSGISLTYFFMLAGSDDLVKPDRMLGRFLRRCLGREVGAQETQQLLTAVAARLRVRYPQLTPGLLDQAIWRQQRSIPAQPGPHRRSRVGARRYDAAREEPFEQPRVARSSGPGQGEGDGADLP
jgi:hypothetical protein